MVTSESDHDHGDAKQTPRCLVIIPAFNESGSIARVVRGLRAHVPHADIVVIDDGSTDDTSSVVPAEAHVLRLPFNLGIGGAMQTGYRFAALNGYDIAIQVDGDGQHPPELVGELFEAMARGDADMVVGSRFLAPGRYDQTFVRMMGIHVLKFWIRVLAGVTIQDCTSGFRAVNRSLILAFADFYPQDYPEPEVLLLILRSKYRVREIDVRMDQRTTGQTSIPFLRGLFYVLKVSVALLLDTIRDPYRARQGDTA